MRTESKNSNRLLRPSAVQNMLGIGKTTFFSLIKEPDFPKKVRISSQAIGFVEQEVIDWIESKKELA